MQAVIIISLFGYIQKKIGKTLGISINTIDSKFIKVNPRGSLKHFYEPVANSTESAKQDWMTEVVKYSINKDSLNERYDYSVNKNEGVFRIITVGDSFTFGVNVPTKNNWTELLEERLNKERMCKGVNKYEVINLGVGGYDTTYELERYKLRGQKYNPDLIVWFVTDLYRITEEFLELTEKMNIDEKDYEKKGIFYQRWRLAREKVMEKYGERGLVNFQLDIFRKFREKNYKNPLLFMTNWSEIEEELGNNKIYYSSSEVENDNRNLLPDAHFNELGHQKFMEEVMAALEKNNLIPCSQ